MLIDEPLLVFEFDEWRQSGLVLGRDNERMPDRPRVGKALLEDLAGVSMRGRGEGDGGVG